MLLRVHVIVVWLALLVDYLLVFTSNSFCAGISLVFGDATKGLL